MTSIFDKNRDIETAARENRPLAFEAEFDGVRRQPAPQPTEPLDPSRYWTIFSGTD